MNRPTAKPLALTITLLAVIVLGVAAVISRDHIAEAWYRWRLERAEGDEKWDVAGEIAADGGIGTRVAEEWYVSTLANATGEDRWSVAQRLADGGQQAREIADDWCASVISAHPEASQSPDSLACRLATEKELPRAEALASRSLFWRSVITWKNAVIPSYAPPR